jgi:hypothetical protein
MLEESFLLSDELFDLQEVASLSLNRFIIYLT